MTTYKIIHPTIKEYEEMDRIRFPFMFTKEARLKEIRYNRKNIRKYNHKLKERIIRLIDENKGKFFDPILRQEIIPMRRNMLKEEKELGAAVDMSFEEFAGIDKLITDFKRVLINNTKKICGKN